MTRSSEPQDRFTKHSQGHQKLPLGMTPRYDGGTNPKLHALIAQRSEEYQKLLSSFLAHQDQIGKLADLLRNDSSLPALDAVALYCLLAEWNPRTFLAIGSGLATRLARESIRSNRLRSKIISIDPGAKPELDNVCDQVIRTPLQDLPADFFQDLSPGDVLFMDGSHRSLPNSDVTVFFTDILPVLKPWGLVHLHDIWLPWDYPAGVAEHAYSEQYLLATALLVAYRIQTVLPNTFISRTPELLSILDPIFSVLGDVDKTGSSYWLTMV